MFEIPGRWKPFPGPETDSDSIGRSLIVYKVGRLRQRRRPATTSIGLNGKLLLSPERLALHTGLFHGGLGPFRHLLLGNVLHVGADRPYVAEGISQCSGTVSVELIL